MSISPKSFVASLALVTLLATSASAAATRTPSGEPGARAPRDENPIVRVIKEIKRRLSHAMDQVGLPPPEVKI